MLVDVALDDLWEHSPIVNHIWPEQDRFVMHHDIRACVDSGDLEGFSYQVARDEASMQWHLRRIAYLVCFGWHDPITIEIDDQAPDGFRITDGHHRLCAALYSKMEYIEATICGYVDDAHLVLPSLA